MSWLTGLIAVCAAALSLGRIAMGRATGTLPATLGAIVACTTPWFIPLSQYTSPGMDCLSGCIVVHTILAPGLLITIITCYIIGGCALVALLIPGIGRRRKSKAPTHSTLKK